jgi:D-alanyl-lipoteichoic acid acyltransferase DltB (MBOAT superfamily)
MSYVFDIYKGRQKPENDFLTYGVFVSFFPLLVAGPIERASHLLPQLKKLRRFNYRFAMEGVYQILWGLFKKMVIADNAAILVNQIFENDHLQGSTLVLGTFLFAFQAYGDFSGYSDIAIGTAKLFGVSLITNFKYPYFSRDFSEFWRRWHISLFSFFRDYVYIPLGGSKGNTLMKIRNTLIVFLISGFWHGAKWTFMFWGLLNALSVIPSQLIKRTKTIKKTSVVAQFTRLPNLNELFSMLMTFGIYNLILIFFRSESIAAGFNYLSRLLEPKQLLQIPKLTGIQNTQTIISLIFILVLLIVEWNYRREEYALRKFQFHKLINQILVFSILGLIIVVFHGEQQNFIYFQF